LSETTPTKHGDPPGKATHQLVCVSIHLCLAVTYSQWPCIKASGNLPGNHLWRRAVMVAGSESRQQLVINAGHDPSATPLCSERQLAIAVYQR